MLAVCHTCRLKHLARPGSDEAVEFAARHRGHYVEIGRPDPRLAKLWRLLKVDLFSEIARGVFRIERLGVAGYGDNANVLTAYGTATAATWTNLNSLANSATAGAQCTAIDNTSNLYDDYMVEPQLGSVAAGTAGNSKAIFFFTHALVDSSGSAYASTGAATPGASDATLTYLDITANAIPAPLLGVVPIQGTNPPATNGGPFSVAGSLGYQGYAPPKFVLGAVNNCGLTLNASNTVNYRGVYFTVT